MCAVSLIFAFHALAARDDAKEKFRKTNPPILESRLPKDESGKLRAFNAIVCVAFAPKKVPHSKYLDCIVFLLPPCKLDDDEDVPELEETEKKGRFKLFSRGNAKDKGGKGLHNYCKSVVFSCP